MWNAGTSRDHRAKALEHENIIAKDSACDQPTSRSALLVAQSEKKPATVFVPLGSDDYSDSWASGAEISNLESFPWLIALMESLGGKWPL